ncbi:MAG: hypothetical protein AB7F43_09695 [Bacteriovoracia bacterium]
MKRQTLRHYAFFAFSFVVLATASCNKGNFGKSGSTAPSTQNLDDNSPILAAESVFNALSFSLNDVEQIQLIAKSKTIPQKVWSAILPPVYADPCDRTRFQPALGTNCDSTDAKRTVTTTFGSCTVGANNLYHATGTATLTFDSQQTCNTWISGTTLPTSGKVVRTTDNLNLIAPNNSYITTTSNLHQNYLNFSLGGGVETEFTASGRSIRILGLQRTRTKVDGSKGFDHSITTPSPLVVVGSRSTGERTINSGSVRVDNNKDKYSIIANIGPVTWQQGCCYPTTGNVIFTVTGSQSGSVLFNFDTGSCGIVKATDLANNTETLQLASCE